MLKLSLVICSCPNSYEFKVLQSYPKIKKNTPNVGSNKKTTLILGVCRMMSTRQLRSEHVCAPHL
jgi:hypothetical protein